MMRRQAWSWILVATLGVAAGAAVTRAEAGETAGRDAALPTGEQEKPFSQKAERERRERERKARADERKRAKQARRLEKRRERRGETASENDAAAQRDLEAIYGGAAAAEEAAAEGGEIWQSPRFVRQFMGSYGVDSELEPGIPDDSVELASELRPLLQAQRFDEATTLLNTVVGPKGSPAFDFLMGNVKYQQDLLDEAAVYYRAAIYKFPNFRRAHKTLGLVHVRKNEYEQAIPALSTVIELGGGDGLVFGLLGFAYLSTEQYISAESALRNAILLQPNDPQWRLALTQTVLKQRKYGEALTLTEELLARDPENATYWTLQGQAYLGLDEPLQAAQCFELVDRLGAADAATLNLLGDIYVNQTLYDLSARAYARSLEVDPDQGVAEPLRRVEFLLQRGANAQAKTLLAATVDRFDSSLTAEERIRLLKVRSRIAVAGGEGGESVTVLEEIVSIDPLDGEALLLLGQHYAESENPERAIFYYERAQNLDDFEADARVRHAQLLVGQSRFDEAVPLLKRAQEVEPRDEVARFLEQVERAARGRRNAAR